MNDRSAELESGVSAALAGGSTVNRSTAGDDELARLLRGLAGRMDALEQQRTQVPAGQITSLRLLLRQSDTLAGMIDSPRTSILGLLVGLAVAAEYAQPGLLGEFLPILQDPENTGLAGMAAAALSLLFGRYGVPGKPAADGSIVPAVKL